MPVRGPGSAGASDQTPQSPPAAVATRSAARAPRHGGRPARRPDAGPPARVTGGSPARSTPGRARGGRRRLRALRVPREGRQASRGRRRRPAARRGGPPVPGPARPRALPVPTRAGRARRSTRRTSTPISGRSEAPTSRRRTSAPGSAPSWSRGRSGGSDSPAAARAATRRIREALARAARRLGNTPTICRRCYVHPAVVRRYLEGSPAGPGPGRGQGNGGPGLRPDEAAVLRFLERQRAPVTRAALPG